MPSDWAVFVLALSIVIRAATVVFSLYKSPKEVNTDLANEMRAGMQVVKDDVEKISDDHHKLSREVSEMTGGMKELRQSMDGLRDQVTALTNVIGIFNARGPIKRN